jgi:hypothetical protein
MFTSMNEEKKERKKGRKSGHELKQGWNLEARSDAEAMEGCFLLSCFTWLAHPAFL